MCSRADEGRAEVVGGGAGKNGCGRDSGLEIEGVGRAAGRVWGKEVKKGLANFSGREGEGPWPKVVIA